MVQKALILLVGKELQLGVYLAFMLKGSATYWLLSLTTKQ